MRIRPFSTARLTVQSVNDLRASPEGVRALRADLSRILTPAVLAPLPPSMALEGGDVDQWIERLAGEAEVLAVQSIDPPQTIGLVILATPDPDQPVSHLGYLLEEAVWGRGIATELLQGLLIAAPAGHGFQAGVAKGNAASARVLEKLGFERCPTQPDPDSILFQITG